MRWPYGLDKLARSCKLHNQQVDASTPQPTMKLSPITYGLFAWLAAEASATALTYKLLANEKACFYTDTETKAQKLAFYFAVRLRLRLSSKTALA